MKISSQLARTCLDILEANSLVLISTEIPLKNATEIYSRRAKLNKDNGGPMLGFDELIPNLERETIDKVGIHAVERDERWLVAFTTPEMDRLLGVLCSTQKSPTAVTSSD